MTGSFWYHHLGGPLVGIMPQTIAVFQIVVFTKNHVMLRAIVPCTTPSSIHIANPFKREIYFLVP
jgi:hypothetical protein